MTNSLAGRILTRKPSTAGHQHLALQAPDCAAERVVLVLSSSHQRKSDSMPGGYLSFSWTCSTSTLWLEPLTRLYWQCNASMAVKQAHRLNEFAGLISPHLEHCLLTTLGGGKGCRPFASATHTLHRFLSPSRDLRKRSND